MVSRVSFLSFGSSLREYVWIGLLFAALLSLLFSESLFCGRIHSAADAVLERPFYRDVRPEGFLRGSNPLLWDQVYQFTPWQSVIRDTWKRGELPLWNPHSHCGVPFVGTHQSAVFYPINILLLFVPFSKVLLFSTIIRLWIAAMSTYILARTYRLDKSPAFVSAIGFALCGYITVWQSHPHTNVAIWLPTLILLAELLLRGRGSRLVLRIGCALAVVLGLQFTGGHIETSADVIFCLGLYYLLRWWQVKESLRLGASDRRRLLLRPLWPLMAGLLIGAVQLLPFLEWMTRSATLAHRTSSGFIVLHQDFWKHLLSLPLFVFPNLYNNPAWDGYYWSFLLDWSNYAALAVYVGTITFVLALLSLGRSKGTHSRVRVVWWSLVIVCLLRAIHAPLANWINQLPLLSLAHPERLRLVVCFGVCLLAGFGAQRLFASLAGTNSVLRRRFVLLCGLVAAGGIVIMASSNVLLPRTEGRLRALAKAKLEERVASSTGITEYPSWAQEEIDNRIESLKSAFKPGNMMMYTPILWAGMGVLAVVLLKKQSRSSALRIAIPAIVAADLLLFVHDYIPSITREEFYPNPPVVEEVLNEKGLFRTTVLDLDLIPDAHIMAGFSDVRGMDFPLRWFDRYAALIPERMDWLAHAVVFTNAESPLLRMLNVRFVISSREDKIRTIPNVAEITRIGSNWVARLLDSPDRGYFVYDALAVGSEDEAVEAVGVAPHRVRDRVVLTEPEPGWELRGPGSKDMRPTRDVLLIEYRPGSAKWRVRTEAEGYFVVSDADYPGWEAYVEGTHVPHYRANVAFRAVKVPEGSHTVEFRFRPASVYAGMGVSLAAVLLVISLFSLSFRQEQAHQGE